MAEEIKTEVAETPAPAAPETPVVETPTLSPILQELAELGFEGLTDEKEALARVVAAHKNLKNEFGTTLSQTLAELRQTQPTAPTQPAQEAQPGSWWNPPAVDEQLVAKYRTADGWKPETPAEIRQQGEAHQAYLDRWANDLVRNAPKALGPAIRAEAQKIVQEMLAGQTQQQQLTQFQQRVFTENAWLFEPDPVTGKPSQSLSAEGQMIDRYVREAQERGADYEFAVDYALTKHQAAKAAAQAKTTSQAQTAEEINAQKKSELLRRSAPGLNRGGSLPTPTENRTSQRNKHIRPGERFVQIAKRDGIAIN
jgi:hypothetical protein